MHDMGRDPFQSTVYKEVWSNEICFQNSPQKQVTADTESMGVIMTLQLGSSSYSETGHNWIRWYGHTSDVTVIVEILLTELELQYGNATALLVCV